MSNLDFLIKAANATTNLAGFYADIIQQVINESKTAMQELQQEANAALQKAQHEYAELNESVIRIGARRDEEPGEHEALAEELRVVRLQKLSFEGSYNRSQLKVVELTNQLALVTRAPPHYEGVIAKLTKQVETQALEIVTLTEELNKLHRQHDIITG